MDVKDADQAECPARQCEQLAIRCVGNALWLMRGVDDVEREHAALRADEPELDRRLREYHQGESLDAVIRRTRQSHFLAGRLFACESAHRAAQEFSRYALSWADIISSGVTTLRRPPTPLFDLEEMGQVIRAEMGVERAKASVLLASGGPEWSACWPPAMFEKCFGTFCGKRRWAELYDLLTASGVEFDPKNTKLYRLNLTSLPPELRAVWEQFMDAKVELVGPPRAVKGAAK